METKKPRGPTLKEFQARFSTDDACLDHMMRVRYGERHDCAKCGKSARYYRVKKRRAYECEHCGNQVYPTAGTPFHKSRTSLRDWFYVMFLFTTTRNGVAAKRVQREIGVTYKTAWRMCHLIRHYMGYVDGDNPIGGSDGKPVEVDHAFFGPGESQGGAGNKAVVMGLVERGGNVITRHIPSRKSGDVAKVFKSALRPGSRVTSDAEHTFAMVATMGHQHTELNRRAGMLERGPTNTIEGYWGLLRRGINGTYISVSAKHLQKYLSEFEFRYNMRHQPHMMLDLLLLSFPRP